MSDAKNYVQTVPDYCDRIVCRGQYYGLPIAAPAPVGEPAALTINAARAKGRREAFKEAMAAVVGTAYGSAFLVINRLFANDLAAQPAADEPNPPTEHDKSGRHWQSHDDGLVSRVGAEPARADRQDVALSDDAIQALWNEVCKDGPGRPGWSRHIRFARAIISRASSSQGVALSVTGDEVRAIVKSAHPGGSDHPSGADYVMATVAYLNRRASSSRAEVESEAGLGDALMEVCRSLPSGCGVVINAENGWAGVTFCDADGNEFDMDDGETSITDQVRNALAAAEAPNGETGNA